VRARENHIFVCTQFTRAVEWKAYATRKQRDFTSLHFTPLRRFV